MSRWLVSHELGGGDAGSGGSGLGAWSRVVRPVICAAKFSEMPMEMELMGENIQLPTFRKSILICHACEVEGLS